MLNGGWRSFILCFCVAGRETQLSGWCFSWWFLFVLPSLFLMMTCGKLYLPGTMCEQGQRRGVQVDCGGIYHIFFIVYNCDKKWKTSKQFSPLSGQRFMFEMDAHSFCLRVSCSFLQILCSCCHHDTAQVGGSRCPKGTYCLSTWPKPKLLTVECYNLHKSVSLSFVLKVWSLFKAKCFPFLVLANAVVKPCSNEMDFHLHYLKMVVNFSSSIQGIVLLSIFYSSDCNWARYC
jgi:hypothetical protein